MTPNALRALLCFCLLAAIGQAGCSGLTVEATDESLKWAIVHHEVDKVRVMLKKNPALAKSPQHLVTAIGWSKNRTEIVSLLLDAGADPNAESGPMLGVINRDDAAMLQYLLERGADPNHKYYGDTLLKRCIHAGRTSLAEILVAHGADVNAVDDRGITALMEVVQWRREIPLIRLFLSHGANVNAVDKSGKSVMDRCDGLRDNDPMVRLLLDSGAIRSRPGP